MGFFESIFKKPRKALDAVNGYFKTLTAYQPVFTSFEGGVYEAMATRAAIHAFATHCSKLNPKVVGSRNEKLERILSHRPNPYMNTSQFLYRVATIYAATNNAFIVPVYDDDFLLMTGYYPLKPEQVELVTGKNGAPYLRYTFASGQKAAIELENAGVMTQMQFRDDFFGESNVAVLEPTLEMINMQNQGIVEGVKTGAALRFLARLTQTLKRETLDDERKRLREDNLSLDNAGGFLLVDGKYADVKQIESKPFIVDEKQMSLIKENIYDYFGVNSEILQNRFSEQTFNAFYEGKIEPFAIQLGLTLTNMTFTDREIAHGNEIMFSSNRLQYASVASKLSVSTQLFDRGIFSINDVCDVWQQPHVPDGDRRFIRGEYVPTDKKTGDDPNSTPKDDMTGNVPPNYVPLDPPTETEHSDVI